MKCVVSQTRKCLLENFGNSFQLNKDLLILCFSSSAPRNFSVATTEIFVRTPPTFTFLKHDDFKLSSLIG